MTIVYATDDGVPGGLRPNKGRRAIAWANFSSFLAASMAAWSPSVCGRQLIASPLDGDRLARFTHAEVEVQMHAGSRILLILTCTLIACVSEGIGEPQGSAELPAPQEERMRLEEPRISPIDEADWTSAQRAYLEPHQQAGRLFNVFKTAANHPIASANWDSFAWGHINSEANTLNPRHRELLILRIGWLCKSEYEWAAHSTVARELGFTEEELLRITVGPDAPGWIPFEATLLRAVDELHQDAFVTDNTWNALSEQYDTQQLMDLTFTVGAYNLVSMVLNSWGVQLDEGFRGFPQSP